MVSANALAPFPETETGTLCLYVGTGPMTAQSTNRATGEMILSISSLVMGEVALMSTYIWLDFRNGLEAWASETAMSALTAETTISLFSTNS